VYICVLTRDDDALGSGACAGDTFCLRVQGINNLNGLLSTSKKSTCGESQCGLVLTLLSTKLKTIVVNYAKNGHYPV
jgi:hypothetical protein